MLIYKLVNHSDPWYFKARDNKIAFLVALYVGSGQTPAERDGWNSGFTIGGKNALGEIKKSYKKQFNEDFDGAIERWRESVAEACLTFMVNRDAKHPWLEGAELDKWNDVHRSSMNDFGAMAKHIAANLAQVTVKTDEETEEKIPIEEIPAYLSKLTAERDQLKEEVASLKRANALLTSPLTCHHPPELTAGACAACHATFIEALEEATDELETILSKQNACGDPGMECPLQDSHKPGSTKDIVEKCRKLIPKKEAPGGQTA